MPRSSHLSRMNRFIAVGCTAAVCFITAALVASTAQAAASSQTATTPKAKEYQLCSFQFGGCSSNILVVTAKGKHWNFTASSEYYGTYHKGAKGTVFVYEGAGAKEGCYLEMKKNKAGYSSSSKPGVFYCPGNEYGYATWAVNFE